MTDQVAKRVTAFFESQRIDCTANYLTRGRKHRSLSDAELGAKWVEAYRSWANDTSNPEALIAENDLQAEFDLRRLDPPVDLVRDERTKLFAKVVEVLSDPEEGRRIGRELAEELEAQDRSAN